MNICFLSSHSALSKNLKKVLSLLFLLLVCSTLNLIHTNTALAENLVKRHFHPVLEGRWPGNGISYGAYRNGESPQTGSLTSRKNILEDLQLIKKRWNLIRLYGAGKQSRNILEVIRDNNLPIKVMQGAWLSGHNTHEQNEDQITKVIKLAKDFPDIIVAVNTGNEIFVDWSWHKMSDMDTVIEYIRTVRKSIKQPVTVNDDYNFWNKPHARKIADEIDFIGMHAYAFWNNKTLEDAIDWSKSTYRNIQALYPEHMIAFTETGWPTSRVFDETYEGSLIGKAGEKEQATFFKSYNEWVNKEGIISFYFEAFDEKWKGGFDGENLTDKAEKHWGLFRSDRTPKQAINN